MQKTEVFIRMKSGTNDEKNIVTMEIKLRINIVTMEMKLRINIVTTEIKLRINIVTTEMKVFN